MYFPVLKTPVLRLICFTGLLSIALSVPSKAATIAGCNSAFTLCLIPENVPLQLPFTAISGDAVVLDPNGSTVSDVFRISNNVVNTGLGTGLGNLAELYSADDGPVPTTFSANAIFILENSSGPITSYTNNGVTYLLGVPEPGTVGLLTVAGACFYVLGRRRTKTARGAL